MDIREQIGNRVTKSRKALGITIKELSARIDGALSAARISNWEQGTRSPGPLEAKLLADQLQVSASYLLCLTDNLDGELSLNNGTGMRFVPFLTMKEVSIANFSFDQALLYDEREKVIVVNHLNQSKTNAHLFALLIEDTSMQPLLNTGDLVIINTNRIPNPGDLVLAYFPLKNQTILRRYGEAPDCLFQLLASNALWATINIKNKEDVILYGVMSEFRRYL